MKDVLVNDIVFSRDEIFRQVDKIFTSIDFSRSDILRRFLTFIVEESLQGHSNQIKEYTIAVEVMKKREGFQPKENCIVRIHAGRLRSALNRYYAEEGMLDPLRISIPVGSYIPLFQLKNNMFPVISNEEKLPADNSLIIAVIPSNHPQDCSFENTLAKGLGLQISSALTEVDGFSVISYHIVSQLSGKTSDIGKIAETFHAKYIITIDIQSLDDRVRIFTQLIDMPTTRQIWSQVYDRNNVRKNMFQLQDDIISLIIPEIRKACKLGRVAPKPGKMIAIA